MVDRVGRIARCDAGQSGLVAAQTGGFVHGTGGTPEEKGVLFGTGYEERAARNEHIKTDEVERWVKKTF